MLKSTQFAFGLTLLILLEISKVYFIMPFPGSQQAETIDIAYFIHQNIFWFRTIGILIVIFPLIHFFTLGTRLSRIVATLALIVYGVILYVFNFKLLADKMFYQPVNKTFAHASQNKVPMSGLVLGIVGNGKSKAYPLEIIGYHHQVRDTIGGVPVMVTYCTVCRTGRVFSPEIDGKQASFRLVGMDQFNAMFEDEETGSWWRQVTGEAVAGPLKGQRLKELPSEQMTLHAWLSLHPDSEILQQDSLFKTGYEDLRGFDKGIIESSLEKRDSLSWKEKSWVVGVKQGSIARAYDWNDLVQMRVINDTLNHLSIALLLSPDSATFRVVKKDSLTFFTDGGKLYDQQTQSEWTWAGESTDGKLKGTTLPTLQAYQEFWHSWRTFHPQTTRFKPAKKMMTTTKK